jgi:hypothetical protein
MGLAGEERSSGTGGIESGEDQVREGRAEIGVRVSWGYFVERERASWAEIDVFQPVDFLLRVSFLLARKYSRFPLVSGRAKFSVTYALV